MKTALFFLPSTDIQCMTFSVFISKMCICAVLNWSFSFCVVPKETLQFVMAWFVVY